MNRSKKGKIKLNTIRSYAPTNYKDEETKENFYNKLQTLCDKLKEKDMTILGTVNENGEMLADFCAFNNMIIGGSTFPHRRIYKANHRTDNQINRM